MSFNKRLAVEPPAAAAVGFNIITWSGNGSSNRSITGVGFQPDIIWIKARTSAEQHYFYDSTRGPFNYLHPNLVNSQANDTSTRLKEFLSDGFKVGNELSVNGNNETYVAWCWKVNEGTTATNTDGTVDSTVQVNADLGISIATFTTPSSPNADTRVGHGLGSTPDMIILKRTDGSEDWYVHHEGIGTGEFVMLQKTNAQATATNLWRPVNSTVFCSSFTGTGSQACIAYSFASVDGFSNFGTYTGATGGVSITTGFQPDWIMIKSTSNVENWAILDSVRGTGKVINPNRSNAEGDSTLNTFTVSSTGFSFPHQDVADAMLNENGYEYLYAAFKINT